MSDVCYSVLEFRNAKRHPPDVSVHQGCERQWRGSPAGLPNGLEENSSVFVLALSPKCPGSAKMPASFQAPLLTSGDHV